MTTCDTDSLSSYLDGELDDDGRGRVAFHLTGCAACREVVADLALIKETAPALADLESRPDADLWPAIASRTQPARATRISLSWMQAIAAGLALAVLSGGGVWIALRGGERAAPMAQGAGDTGPGGLIAVADFGDAAYESAVKDLREALDKGRNRLDPQTIQVLETNLAAIDQAIAEARAALSADPANVSLNNYLADVRRRKLALLRTAGELAQPEL
jgi:hypothetical protein